MVIHSVISTPKYFAYLSTHSARSIGLCCFRNTYSKQMQVPGLSEIHRTNQTTTQLSALKSPWGRRKSCEFTNGEIIWGGTASSDDKWSFILSIFCFKVMVFMNTKHEVFEEKSQDPKSTKDWKKVSSKSSTTLSVRLGGFQNEDLNGS